jgi:hypothetical protein
MKKNDFYLLGSIIILIAVGFLLMQLFKNEGRRLIVTIDGKEYMSFYLNEDTTYKIEHDDGEWNTFEIRDGYVKMIDASCPDKLCVKQGKAHYTNERITCLPNGVVLEIFGGEESDLDAIAE